jgi:hypothetical protein
MTSLVIKRHLLGPIAGNTSFATNKSAISKRRVIIIIINPSKASPGNILNL